MRPSITLLLWFLLLLLLLHVFFVIGNRSKKSLSVNPTELGGARRLWAPTCKHWMVSAATPAFPYPSLATSFDDSTRMSSVRSIFASCHPLHFCSGFCCCFCCFIIFFHRRQEQEVFRQESHRTGRSPKCVGGDVPTSHGERHLVAPSLQCAAMP